MVINSPEEHEAALAEIEPLMLMPEADLLADPIKRKRADELFDAIHAYEAKSTTRSKTNEDI